MDIEKVTEALFKSWTPETSYKGTGYSYHPYGQCAVTALLIQEKFGGFIQHVYVDGQSHYYNVLSDGTKIDFTWLQFTHPRNIEVAHPSFNPEDFEHDIELQKRYTLLKEKFEKYYKED